MKPAHVLLDPGSQGIPDQIDEVMGPDRDLACKPGRTRIRYLLCSTPRSGSTMIAGALRGTGVAGDPLEYLNPRLMWGWARRSGCSPSAFDVLDYLRQIESLRTSPSGVFGMKVHSYQLPLIWGKDWVAMKDFLARFDHLVFLTRRDKLAQAVSLYRAQATQLWTSEDRLFLDKDDPRLRKKVGFNAGLIASSLHQVARGEAGWASLFQASGRSATMIEYEAAIEDMPGALQPVFDLLGLTDVAPAAPGLTKQAPADDPLLRQFRRYLGLDAGGR